MRDIEFAIVPFPLSRAKYCPKACARLTSKYSFLLRLHGRQGQKISPLIYNIIMFLNTPSYKLDIRQRM